jgi:hypothetical protein
MQVIVFDVAVPVRLAFYALVEHGMTQQSWAMAR